MTSHLREALHRIIALKDGYQGSNEDRKAGYRVAAQLAREGLSLDATALEGRTTLEALALAYGALFLEANPSLQSMEARMILYRVLTTAERKDGIERASDRFPYPDEEHMVETRAYNTELVAGTRLLQEAFSEFLIKIKDDPRSSPMQVATQELIDRLAGYFPEARSGVEWRDAATASSGAGQVHGNDTKGDAPSTGQ